MFLVLTGSPDSAKYTAFSLQFQKDSVKCRCLVGFFKMSEKNEEDTSDKKDTEKKEKYSLLNRQ